MKVRDTELIKAEMQSVKQRIKAVVEGIFLAVYIAMFCLGVLAASQMIGAWMHG